MTNVDTREISRNSFFMMAEVCAMDETTPYRLRVRNLSAGGMMAEGNAPFQRGSIVTVTLRNIGEVQGTVAWRQDQRCGIAFDEEIDVALAREPQADKETPVSIVSRRIFAQAQPAPTAALMRSI